MSSGNKQHRRVVFYSQNHVSGVPELELLSLASHLMEQSAELFIRQAALEKAARVIQASMEIEDDESSTTEEPSNGDDETKPKIEGAGEAEGVGAEADAGSPA